MVTPPFNIPFIQENKRNRTYYVQSNTSNINHLLPESFWRLRSNCNSRWLLFLVIFKFRAAHFDVLALASQFAHDSGYVQLKGGRG